MAGRFLTASFLCAVILLAKQLPSAHQLVAPAAVLTAAIVSLIMPPSPLRMRPFALADPLLARMNVDPDMPWRIGHFARTLPDGYEDTMRLCVQRLFPNGAIRPPAGNCLASWDEINRFRDPSIAKAYHELMLITQGPLFDRARLVAIARWNLGRDPLSDRGEGPQAHSQRWLARRRTP